MTSERCVLRQIIIIIREDEIEIGKRHVIGLLLHASDGYFRVNIKFY